MEKFSLGLIMLFKVNVLPGRHVKSVTYYIAKLILYAVGKDQRAMFWSTIW